MRTEAPGLRVAITGATGNVGTALVRVLGADDRVAEVVGVARRVPGEPLPKTTWRQADVATGDLAGVFDGVDAVVHLAWLIQPARDEETTRRVNVDGSRRVFEAAAAAGVGTLVHASSVGAYSLGPKDRAVDEDWPTDGIETSFYSRHKADAERALDRVEREHPRLRVVRLRPGLIFQREAAQEIRRYFAGPLLPSPLVRPAFVRVVPRLPRLVVQGVHSADVADAYRRAVLDESARGAYNVAAEPVLDPDTLARAFGAVQVPASARVVRALADWTYRARLQPTPPGWLDLALGVPVMDVSRIRDELGWAPRHSALDALKELLDGMARRQGADTPPLRPDAGGPGRLGEFVTGVGGRNP